MVVETIVSFAKKMDMKTIAEFVEKMKRYSKIINELEIDYSQRVSLQPTKTGDL